MSEASEGTTTSYELVASSEEALERLRESLGSDTIVREEEDGIGRYAGDRPILLVGRRGEGAKLLRGPWSEIKGRQEEAMVEVSFERDGGTVRIQVERVEKSANEVGGVARIVGDFVSTAILIAAAIYAFNQFRGQAIDYNKMAMVVAGATTLYVVAKQFLVSDEEKMGPADWLMSRAEIAFAPAASDDSSSA